MVDLDGHAAFLPDAQRLVHRLEDLVRFGAHVRDVEAAVRRHRLDDLDQLLGARVVPGRINEGGAEAERAVLHGAAQGGAHGVQRRAGGGAHAKPHPVLAQRARADERADVGRDAARLHRTEPGVEPARPHESPRRGARGAVARAAADRELADRRGRVALAHDLRRDALRELADASSVTAQERTAPTLDVDEAGRDDLA
jgi:hypothetical protein